jgi:hypothetical protein
VKLLQMIRSALHLPPHQMQMKDEREKQRLREQLEEQESSWLEYQARVYSHEDQHDDR